MQRGGGGARVTCPPIHVDPEGPKGRAGAAYLALGLGSSSDLTPPGGRILRNPLPRGKAPASQAYPLCCRAVGGRGWGQASSPLPEAPGGRVVFLLL